MFPNKLHNHGKHSLPVISADYMLPSKAPHPDCEI